MKGAVGSIMIGVSLSLSLNLAAAEDFTSYPLPITRQGKTATRVALNFWPGEYPAPVIDFGAKTAGEGKVTAFKSLRDLKAPVACTIKHGLYHPWSKTKGSALEFYTLRALEEYQALQDQALGENKLKKGDKITEVIPLSEGVCAAKRGKARLVDFECALLDEAASFKPLSAASDPWLEQWLYLDCKEGYKAFIRDIELLKAPGAAEGEIVQMGEVGPHK
jgi:hypothetical protein